MLLLLQRVRRRMGNAHALNAAHAASLLSMQHVMGKDKAKWLELFAENACIEDPVGVSPLDASGQGHRGRAAVEAFWDSNISPNEFVFNIVKSIAPEGGCEVANVGQIVTRVASFKSTTVTNGIFIYKVDAAGKIVSLRAFYHFQEMLKSTTRWPRPAKSKI